MNTSAEWPLAPPAYSTSSAVSGAGSTSTPPTSTGTGASPAFTGPTMSMTDKIQMCKDNAYLLFGGPYTGGSPSIVILPVHDRVVAAVVSSRWIRLASVPCGNDKQAIDELFGVLREKIRLYLSGPYETYLKEVPGSRGWKHNVAESSGRRK